MQVAEDMVKYIINYVLENAPEEMEFFNKFVDKGLLDRLHHVVSSDFDRVPYTRAVEILQNSGEEFQYPVEWGIDLQTEHGQGHFRGRYRSGMLISIPDRRRR